MQRSGFLTTVTVVGLVCSLGGAPGSARAQAGGNAPAVPPTAPAGSNGLDAFAGPIRSGDSLHVVVAGEETLGGDFRVENDGTISLPRLGPVSAAGKSQAAVAADISQIIVEKKLLKHADVSVYITGRKVRNVTINGAVTNQGPQPIKDATVLSEILEGSMPTSVADLSRVSVTHADGTSQTVNYLQFRNGIANTAAVNPPLQDGDRIYVYSSLPAEGTVRVVGEVKDQSKLLVPITTGMTVGQVLQLVGGVTDYADRSGIALVRGGARLPVPYDDILRHASGKDIVLQDKDEIDVPKLDKPRQVTVAGAVREPKAESLLSRLTLLEAIAQAGGPQDGAQQGQVELRRRDSAGNLTTHIYDLSKDNDASTELIDGDYVFLPYPKQRSHVDAGTVIGILSGLAVLFGALRR